MRVFIYCAILAMLTAGCSKDKRELKKANASLKGEWELRMVSGTMLPPATYAPGNGNRLQFDGLRFEKYENGTLVNSGRYSVVHEADAQNIVCLVVDPGTFDQKILFSPESGENDMLIEIDGNNMSILTGCFAIDAGARLEYVRSK